MAESAGMGLNDYLGVVKRRGWIVALCFILLTPLALGVAYVLPPVYSATAHILVESQQIPDELARSTVTASAAERMEVIRQRLLTRQNLTEIIEKYDLYSEFDQMNLGDKIERLRAHTAFESIEYGGGGRRRGAAPVSAFTISFNAPAPVRSAAVANEFVTRALDLNLRQRTERATETVAFFQQAVSRLSAEILDLENQIVAFKSKNADSLPETSSYRHDEIQSLEKQIYDGQERRLALETQRQEIESVLAQGLTGVMDEKLTPEQKQINTLRNTLAQQRGVLAPSHPTIRALEARISSLKKELETVSPETGQMMDPMEQQRERLERQIRLITREIEKIGQRADEAEEKLVTLHDAVKRAPQVEIALSSLQRRLSEAQMKYASASAKLAEAETGEKLEVNRQAERLVVIEQAQVPTAPDSPNRVAIAGIGVGGSLMFGVALAVLLELLNTSIRSSSDLQRRVKLRPIVVIPYIMTQREIRARRWRLVIVALVILVGVPAILFAIDQYVLPLSVLAERFADKTGLNRLIELIERRF